MTVVKNPFEKMEWLHRKQSPKCSTWVQSQKQQNDFFLSVHFQGKPFNITEIQVYAPTNNTEQVEVEQFYEDLQDILEWTPKKMSFSLQGTGMQKQEVKKHLE